MVMAVQCGMPISEQALRDCIHKACLPLAKRQFVFVTITAGLAAFLENHVRSYYSESGKTDKNRLLHTAPHEVGMSKLQRDMY